MIFDEFGQLEQNIFFIKLNFFHLIFIIENKMAKCHIQFIKLAKTCIILNFESKSYIFNVSEGYQRYCSDFSIKTKLSTQIFFTNLNVSYMNGIIGLLLTLNFDK